MLTNALTIQFRTWRKFGLEASLAWHLAKRTRLELVPILERIAASKWMSPYDGWYEHALSLAKDIASGDICYLYDEFGAGLDKATRVIFGRIGDCPSELGECEHCHLELISNIKHETCPRCGSAVGLT